MSIFDLIDVNRVKQRVITLRGAKDSPYSLKFQPFADLFWWLLAMHVRIYKEGRVEIFLWICLCLFSKYKLPEQTLKCFFLNWKQKIINWLYKFSILCTITPPSHWQKRLVNYNHRTRVLCWSIYIICLRGKFNIR